jgi:pimeloyl-ACP methyl ester carboxylesterase
VSIGGDALIATVTSHALELPHPEIETAVIVIHGAGRDADVYFATMMGVVRAADAARLTRAETTLVIAPQFLTQVDARGHRLPLGAAYWSGAADWTGGDAAMAPDSRPTAFAALDTLLESLADRARFPVLRRIVVAGHSAGGQIVQRYAVVGRGEAKPAGAGIAVRYVVANPSSYLYLTAERPTDGGGFAPHSNPACRAFDDYRFGFTNAPAYVTARPRASIIRAYQARQVVYLLGTADNDPGHRALDRSCGAMAQGAHRLARGEAFHRYVLHLLGAEATATHRKVLVEGAGHDSRAMFRSPAGIAALFGELR